MPHASIVLFVRAVSLVLCLVMTAQSADAQGRRRAPGPGGMLGILLNPKVMQELGIKNDEEKRQKLKLISEMIVKEREEIRQSAKGDQDQYLTEAYRNVELKHRDELKQIMTAEQYQRLQQITWQQLNYDVLPDPEVADALKLKAEQIKDIVTAQRENATQQREYFGKLNAQATKPDKAEILRGADEIIAAYNKKIEEILTQTQREKFEEMKGQPFDAKK